MATENQKVQQVAVVGVLREQDRLLVIKRSSQVIAPGKICFPGGSIEPGESLEQALIREFKEEVALNIEPQKQIWTSVTSWNCQVHWWSVSCQSPFQARVDPTEVAAVGWRGIDELLADSELLESNRQFLEQVVAGQISF